MPFRYDIGTEVTLMDNRDQVVSSQMGDPRSRWRFQGRVLALGVAAWLMVSGVAFAERWWQFRGPAGSGIADAGPLPDDLANAKLVWKSHAHTGHSSPVLVGDRLFVTAIAEESHSDDGRERDDRGTKKSRPAGDVQLLTIAFDAITGARLWEAASPFEKLESTHRIGNPATASVVTDGERVISFFGSSGLSCFSLDGQLKWRKRLGPFNNQFGAAASPVLIDDLAITIQDHDTGSYLAAYEKETGKQVWRVERPEARRNYSTPTIWKTDAGAQVVIAGTAHITGYEAATGHHAWTVRGLCRVVSNTPVVGDNGWLYVASTGGGSATPQPGFTELLGTADENSNGKLESSELPGSPIKSFFGQFDKDGDGALDREEYEGIRRVFRIERSQALAIRPGGEGDITDSHVAWTYEKSLPRNASPILYRDRMFFVKDGGILTCLDAQSGKLLNRVRLAGTGEFFSSPIVGDGKLYLISARGKVNVVAADASLKQLSVFSLGEDVMATPAIDRGRLYIRGAKHIFCFSAP